MALPILLTVAFTSTVPASWDGVITVQLVVDVEVTDVARALAEREPRLVVPYPSTLGLMHVTVQVSIGARSKAPADCRKPAA